MAAETARRDTAPLDELMLAMDVVDTLRHQELVVARELNAEERERQLKQRLREIYASQGIEVSEDVLEQGVRALREERFVYTPPEPGLGRTLAVLYVTRDRWGKWVGGAAAVIAAVVIGYQLLVRGPELRAIEALPAELETAQQRVEDVTDDPEALREAAALATAGEVALGRRDFDEARAAVGDLRELAARLEREYDIRIVSRPGELSGVWRVPESNEAAQNYYLIVEAVTPDGERLTLPIENEEDGRTYRVSRWGLRVDEETFQRVARDKRDDGIIQQAVVGRKRRGELDPEYDVPTTGAAITDW